MGITGYTQGVKLVTKPPKKQTRGIFIDPPESKGWIEFITYLYH